MRARCRPLAALALACQPAALLANDAPAIWPPARPGKSRDAIGIVELVRMRDIGNPEPALAGPSPLAASPDGRRIAFVLWRADERADTFRQALLVLDLAAPDTARIVDMGGEQIRAETVLRGQRTAGGVVEVATPQWSPDGTAIAYRKRISGVTQAWRVDLEGKSHPVTASATDVEGLAWSADGQRIIYTTRPSRTGISEAIDGEALSGFLYDERILPGVSPRPRLPAEIPSVTYSVASQGGDRRLASETEALRLGTDTPLGSAPLGPVPGRGGDLAGAEPVGSSPLAKRRVWFRRTGREEVSCSSEVCAGTIGGVWWDAGGEVIFLRREGWGDETSALYRWRPGSERPRLVLRSQPWLSGCAMARDEVICLRESAASPREIVAISLADGRTRVLFDPNPELRGRFPPVARLRWRNDRELPAWGDLVLPEGPAPPGGWPLVVVQYRSVGFLRGGTGDEVPVFPLAARGIAVLSFHRPPLVASLDPSLADADALVRATFRDWSERRSVQSSLARGLRRAIATGKIDAARIGLSGLSDGSSTVRYALLHGPDIAAASIGTCCTEPLSSMALGGLAQADWLRRMGFPPATQPDPGFWQDASLALNADRITTPILMQLADDEYLDALETYTALREQGGAVEMHVFPDEHHIKWRPAHRLALYQRNLDWFAFWLKDAIDPDPAKAAQYRRWESMRATRQEAR